MLAMRTPFQNGVRHRGGLQGEALLPAVLQGASQEAGGQATAGLHNNQLLGGRSMVVSAVRPMEPRPQHSGGGGGHGGGNSRSDGGFRSPYSDSLHHNSPRGYGLGGRGARVLRPPPLTAQAAKQNPCLAHGVQCGEEWAP